MRKPILLLLLAIVSGNTMAAWVKVGTTALYSFYADPSTIQKEGAVVRMWNLSDWDPPGIFNSRFGTFSSLFRQDEYDCKEKRWRTLSFVFYSGNMGEGDVVNSNSDPTPSVPIVPHSAEDMLWKFACGKR